jgi:hypothetical protein
MAGKSASNGQVRSQAISRSAGTRLDPARYWVGGALTAVVAALAGVIGLIVARGILHIPVLLPHSMTVGLAAAYGLASAGIALVAALLYFGMLHLAPRPGLYYGWVVGLFTVLAVLLPFTAPAMLSAQIAFAAMNLLVGLVILTLVPVSADNARIAG